MKHTTTVTLALAGTLLIAGALTGCSTGTLPGGAGGAGGAGAAGGTSGGSSSNPPSSSGGGSGSTFTLPTACLSATDVATTLGVDAYGPTTAADSTSLTCEYLTATKDGPIIDIEPANGFTPSTFLTSATAKPPAGATVSKVSGIGDAAVVINFSDGDHSILVLAGKFTIDIAGGKTAAANVEQLAKQVLAG